VGAPLVFFILLVLVFTFVVVSVFVGRGSHALVVGALVLFGVLVFDVGPVSAACIPIDQQIRLRVASLTLGRETMVRV
jgi:hypothetical protein